MYSVSALSFLDQLIVLCPLLLARGQKKLFSFWLYNTELRIAPVFQVCILHDYNQQLYFSVDLSYVTCNIYINLNPGRYISERTEKEDSKRIYHAERKSGEGALVARQQRRTERIYQEERHIEMREKLMFLKDFETPFISIFKFSQAQNKILPTVLATTPTLLCMVLCIQ